MRTSNSQRLDIHESQISSWTGIGLVIPCTLWGTVSDPWLVTVYPRAAGRRESDRPVLCKCTIG